MQPGVVVALVVLALAHVVVGRLPALISQRWRAWLSFSGGVAVAYVFVHLLPELAAAQETFDLAAPNPWVELERHGYLIALAGLVTFYGVEGGVRRHRRDKRLGAASDAMPFWLHVGSFAAYNALIGYLLVRGEERSPDELALYTVAMFLHFLVVDVGLAKDHQAAYDSRARWVLSLAIVGGCGIGLVWKVSELAVSALVGFLAGGVLLNVLKEELPAEEDGRFGAFLAGAAFYAALLLSV